MLRRLFGREEHRAPEPDEWRVTRQPPPNAPGDPPPPVQVAEPTYPTDTCPHCLAPLADPPKGNSRCKACDEAISVRKGLDGLRYLLRQDQVEAFERDREEARRSARQREEFTSGSWRLDVVGESFYQQAIEPAFRRQLHGQEVIAMLIREPDNSRDHSAVAVQIDGRTVGHIGREDIPNIEVLLARLTREHGRPTASAYITGGPPKPYYGVVLEPLRRGGNG